MGNDEQLLKLLNELRGSKTLIVGIGNTLKADDAAGPLVCQQLQNSNIDVIDVGSVPENYIRPIVKKAPQNLIIIDAVDFQAKPGAIKIFKPQQLGSFALSTHTLSPHLFIDAVKSQIDVDIYFIGIQPANLNIGQPVSPEVNNAIRHLVHCLDNLIYNK